MEQQGNHSKMVLIDPSIWPSDEAPDQIHSDNMWRAQGIEFSEDHLGIKGSKKIDGGTIVMSKEELKIRGELEIDIERDLEEEIKDGIYHLALRLHRLYQHQRERHARESSTNWASSSRNNALFSELNLTIRMEGGSKIEIKEIKKEWKDKGVPTRTSMTDEKQGKEFNWVRTLRSGSSHVAAARKKHEMSHSMKNVVRKESKNYSIASRQKQKGETYVENMKVLELGWRS